MGIPKFGYACVLISMVMSPVVVFMPLCSDKTVDFIEKYTPGQTLEGVLRKWLVGSLSPNCDPNNPEHLWAQVGLYIALLLSHLFLNRHVWNSLGKTAIPSLKWIFIQPLYCGILLEQSFMFRRRLPEDVDVDGNDVDAVEDVAHIPPKEDSGKSISKKPMVYACGTMWHESETEMRQMLASIIRQDVHHKVVEIMKRMNNSTPKTNSATPKNSSPETRTPESVHVSGENDAPSTSYEVTVMPYGGRIKIKMKETFLYVHLKDRKAIRDKKRWSQVMYMYYLLQYNTNPENPSKKHDENDLDNVYLLAMDGDVDFHADALTSLVKEMASDKKLGAACGRIHPIGSGPMVWYQKFEYAIGHWLQKSAEHVLGCVLCSPGCFSLFRGKAVKEVLDIYSDRPKKAIDYLQFDQGEDRWLCTLLLQNGRSIKYCAAADAKTYAPETFSEFYNQRRRWSVSTVANLYDLISNGWETSTINDNISFGFIVYQALLLVSSLLGPATVLMAITTSITTLFIADLSNNITGSLIANGIIILPIVMYMYYLLQYNTNPENPSKKHDENDLDNVYLLAMDGDVDFHADALTSLVKEMASDKKLGAACGRIHPIGTGPMVWYQKFEYAIGHWLQKSAEHVLGCVLCSPGCFSLFRGKAVKEVLDIYSDRPKKAIDYLQFDQ
ncbi:uncharacterized protein LOC106167634, partial [Lingula anatina]|uniref:chitin synthase n=1 Tax=Lingula anatina TaxID=7574 RepID=A0A2R2MLP9_LINAN